jgi:hypothetical protein
MIGEAMGGKNGIFPFRLAGWVPGGQYSRRRKNQFVLALNELHALKH